MTETRHAYLFKGIAGPCLLALADMSLFVYKYKYRLKSMQQVL